MQYLIWPFFAVVAVLWLVAEFRWHVGVRIALVVSLVIAAGVVTGYSTYLMTHGYLEIRYGSAAHLLAAECLMSAQEQDTTLVPRLEPFTTMLDTLPMSDYKFVSRVTEFHRGGEQALDSVVSYIGLVTR